MAGQMDEKLLFPSFPSFRERPGPLDPSELPDGMTAPGPPVRVRLPPGGWAWLVTRHADVREVLRHPAFSSDRSRPGFPRFQTQQVTHERLRAGDIVRMDAPDHTRLRRVLNPEFTPKAMRNLEPFIQRAVDESIDDLLLAGPPGDLVASFAQRVPSVVICHLLGLPYATFSLFREHSRTVMNRSTSSEVFQNSHVALRNYFDGLIDQYQHTSGEGLSARVAERVRTGELTRDEAGGMCLDVMIAGHDTTLCMLTLSLAFLLQHPEHYATLSADPVRGARLVEELLRYFTVIQHGLHRVALEDVHVGGQIIRAGEGAIALTGAANRDETVFTDANRFDPDRESRPQLSFGFGVHQCVGQVLARVELRIALTTLARRIPDLRLAVSPAEITPRLPSAAFYGLERLPATW